MACLALVVIAGGAATVQAADSWTPTGSMTSTRFEHTATLLQNGKVLVIGGVQAPGPPTTNVELYDPVSETWSAAASMSTRRYEHTATLLQNGKVLVAGGSTSSSGTDTVELYDPTSDSWSAAASMSTPRYEHTATLLANGKVLVAGGWTYHSPTATAELYDPASDSWSAAGSMITDRHYHSATRLADGKILVVGGRTEVAGSTIVLRSAELYDPAGDSWSAVGSMISVRDGHVATALASGKVMVSGGYTDPTFATPSFAASAELYDPATGTWSPGGTMTIARFGHTATRLQDGRVLAAGGAGVFPVTTAAELYDPASNTWTATASMGTPRNIFTATLLPSGKVLVAGGNNQSGLTETAELYGPASADPTIETVATASASVGGQISDVATVRGLANPVAGSTVHFRLYGPGDTACAQPPVYESLNRPLTLSAGSAMASAAPFTTLTAGTYRWRAFFSGDANNAPVAGPCNATDETSIVSRAIVRVATTASPSIALGGQMSDAATVNAIVNGQPSATIDFRLYGPGDATCSGQPVFVSAGVPYPAAGGPVTSAPFSPALPGTYRWRAFYSGDANNAPASGACDDANESVLVTPAVEPAQLDHFKCYTVKRRPIAPRLVTLRDEFDTRQATVREARQLCNPVRKTFGATVTPIANPAAHLVCRRTTDSPSGVAVRTVRLRNQFGTADTKTTGAQTLCIPSLKRVVRGTAVAPAGSDPERVLDHLRCYGVQPRSKSLAVALRDQFGSSNTKTIALVRLCNPVRKTYARHRSPIKFPRAHLACYTISDGGVTGSGSFSPRDVIVRNQFGLARMRATAVETLCLPTFAQVLAVGPIRR